MVWDTTDFNGACNQHGPSYDNRIQEQLQRRILVSSKGKQGRQTHGSTVAINDDWNCASCQGAVRRCAMYIVDDHSSPAYMHLYTLHGPPQHG